jgi:hypothetical protein
MNQKKFMDIERIKGDYALGFRKGDIVWLEEKFDGSNASIRYDVETGKLVAFSRKRELSFDMTLNGFFNYVESLNAESFKDTPNYVVFGEWAVKNAITYYPESMKKWYVYDIYDVKEEKYLPQEEVKAFAKSHGLTFINVFYIGEFIDWEHVQSFVGKSAYGDIGEGVVIKNQTRLNDPNSRLPFVVKIVGEKFQEVKKDNHIRKMEDPQKLQEKEVAMNVMESIVTKRRVEKELYKMRDEGILPNEWCDKDMVIVARTLPKRIYADCMKEESEEMAKAGEYAGKFGGQLAMKYAREIILG